MIQTKQETHVLCIGDLQIPYELERKRVKRLNLRVRRDATVHLSVPIATPPSHIERFLREKTDWIAKARARMLASTPKQTQLSTGDTVYIAGEVFTVQIQAGARTQCVCRDHVLLLSVRNPLDTTEPRQALRCFVKKQARIYLTARMQAILPLFSPRPATFPTLSFRWMKSRWGSCTASKNHITLNEKLLFVSPHLADYVIYHELCHFVHQNHSPAFYRHLAVFVPSYAAARRELATAEIPEL